MADPISDLRGAGFSDDEIAAYNKQKREELSGAGFKDNEIDAYLTGGPVVPDKIPQALLDRFSIGQDISKFFGKVKTDFGPAASRVLDATTEGWAQGVGPEPYGFSPKSEKDLADSGVFRNPDKPSVTDGLRFMNEAWMRPAAGMADATMRAFKGATHAIGGAFGSTLEETGAASQGTAQRAKRDIAGMLDTAVILSGAQVPISRVQRMPDGTVRDVPIGNLPKSEDFVTASKSIAGDDAPASLTAKLATLYNEHGILPAEVAHDALTDPTVKQSMLSSVKEDLPSRYVPSPAMQKAMDAAEQLKQAVKADGTEPAKTLDFTEAKRAVTGEPQMPKAANLPETGTPSATPAAASDKVMQAADEMKTLAAAQKADVVTGEVGAGGKPPAPPKDEAAPAGGDEPPKPLSYEEAQQKILGKISIGASDPKQRMTLDKLYTKMVDDLHPLKGVDEDAYQLARLTRGQFAKAQHFLEHGTFNFKTYETNGKSLKEIMAPIRDDLDGWRAYAAAKRAIDIEAQGKTSGMDLAAAQEVVSKGADRYEGITKQIGEYQDKVLDYLKDAGVVGDKQVAAMREANKNYVPFFRLMGEQAGGGKAGKGFGPGSPIKKLEGSERDIIDPLESIIKNTYLYISVAERNAVGIKLIDALKKAGNEVASTKLPAKDADLSSYLAEQGIKNGDDLTLFVKGLADDGETISAYRDGAKETVRVNDPELVKAFRGLDTQNLDMLMRILAVPAKGLRAGAVLSPDFIARNIVRDLQSAFINTKGGIFTPIDTAKGLIGIVRKDEDFQSWLKSGGANATLVSLDRRYLQESLTKLTGETGLGSRAWNVLNPMKGLRMLSELTENATRLGEFKKVLGDSKLKEDMQAAGYSSREVTLDFSRIGANMRAYNAITAFGNASIQGTDRLRRAFIDNPVQTSARIAGGITMPSVLLWWANHDDERYKELPAWQKDLFWIILTDKWEQATPDQAAMRPDHLRRAVGDQWYVNNGHTWRIPKPFEAGILFGSGAERALDATVGNNPEAFKHFHQSMTNAFSPNFVPTIAAPMVDQFANRSTFTDRTLIPSSLEKHLPEYQYTEYTTETAKALGQIIAAFPGIRDASVSPDSGAAGSLARATTSPILIENYVRSWTGGLGFYALQAADAGLRKTGVLPDPVKPEATLADIPVVRAFAVRYPSASAASIQDFYDGNTRAKAYYDTWLSKAKEGDASALARIQAAGGPGMFVRLDGYEKVLGQHSKLVRDIYSGPETPAEKRQLIDQLYYSMISIAQSGRELQRQIDKASEIKVSPPPPPRAVVPTPTVPPDLPPRLPVPPAQGGDGGALRFPQ